MVEAGLFVDTARSPPEPWLVLKALQSHLRRYRTTLGC
jgi:hypothetical protein